MKKLSFILSAFALFLFSCSNSSDIEEMPDSSILKGKTEKGDNANVDFENYSLTGSSCQWAVADSSSKVVYIINKKSDLESLVDCANEGKVPEINFDKYSLLLTYGKTLSGISQIDKQLSKTNEQNYSLKIDLKMNMTSVIERWVVALLIPKIDYDTTINLEVSENY